MRQLLLFACAMYMTCDRVPAKEPDAKSLAANVIASAGGKDKLLKQFRMKERFNAGAKRTTSATTRTSIVAPPKYWWVGATERGVEPAKTTTWAWTLGVLTDAKSQVALIPGVTEDKTPLDGLRITGTVSPALDMYFDKKTRQLVRVDWRNDIYIFSEWHKYDGTRYPAKCIMYKRKARVPWFHHEIIQLERLKKLPANLKK